MSKHTVVCYICGRRFNADRLGTGYNSKSRRYACPSCTSAERKSIRTAQADKREASTGMRQSNGGMIIKFVVSALFLVSSFSLLSEGNVVSFFTGIIISAALFLWGFLPYRKAKKNRQIAEEVLTRAEVRKQNDIANTPWICTYCGASTKGERCEYCDMPKNG